jgi:hypothetical protein
VLYGTFGPIIIFDPAVLVRALKGGGQLKRELCENDLAHACVSGNLQAVDEWNDVKAYYGACEYEGGDLQRAESREVELVFLSHLFCNQELPFYVGRSDPCGRR